MNTATAQEACRVWLTPLRDNESKLRQMLAHAGACACPPGRTWWGRRRPVEHTELCRIRDAFVTEVELCLVLVARAIETLTTADVDRFNTQMTDTLTAGYRWLAARHG